MNGIRMNLTPKRNYNFGPIAVPASPNTNSIKCDIAERINVTQFNSGVLVVRAFSHSVESDFDSVLVEVVEDGFTTEDPPLNMLGNTLATVTINKETPAGAIMLTDSFSTGFSSMVRVAVTGNRNHASVSTNAIDMDLQIDLILRYDS